MTVIVCVDNNCGMLFNNRRQSRDRVLVEDVVSNYGNILVNEFSAPLFDGKSVTVCDNPLDRAGDNDTCFVENLSLAPYFSKISSLVVYCWNRDYPSDFGLDIDVSTLIPWSVTEFKGSSHDKITKQIYMIKKVVE